MILSSLAEPPPGPAACPPSPTASAGRTPPDAPPDQPARGKGGSGGAQGVGGGQAGGPDGRVDAGGQADEQRAGEAGEGWRGRQHRGDVLDGRVAQGDQDAEAGSGGGAEQAEQGRLDQEQQADRGPGGAERAAQADLAAPF